MIDKNKIIAELDKLDCIRNINYYTNNCNSHDDIVSTIEEMFENEQLSAEEMFEELGFYKVIYNVGNIIKWLNQDIDCMIAFYASDREYRVFGDCYINLEIHRAINRQCQELWWL